MPLADKQKFHHLLWRAGFGPKLMQLQEVQGSPADWYKTFTSQSSAEFRYIDVIDPSLKNLAQGGNRRMADEDERRMIRRKNRDTIKQLNLAWLDEMVNSDAQLREKLALFWHGHFACRSQNSIHQQLLLNVVRKEAIGNFGTLLKSVSKSAAMLNFLNNNQNRKGHPNENFAREVMELFTLGRGHYSEADVKEAARAFTGWGADVKGEFIFRKGVHDSGSKSFLNKFGNFDGDNIIDILLEQKQTAKFIAAKLYRYFVNDDPENQKITWLGERFYSSGYDVGGLMRDIFTSDWFYEAKHIGTRIKSPVELLAGIRRILPMELENKEMQLLVQRILGQLLLYPPNVAGWPGGRNWIDSSSLMFRLRLPQLLKDADEIAVKPKDDDDQTMGMMETAEAKRKKPGGKRGLAGGYQLKANIDWDRFLDAFKTTARQELPHALSSLLLSVQQPASLGLLNKYTDGTSRKNYIQTLAIQLMSTPEYQMC